MCRIGAFLICDGEQIVRQRQLKDPLPVATIQQIRLPRLLIGDKRRINRIRHGVRIYLRQWAMFGVNQGAVVSPRSTPVCINPICRCDPNCTVSHTGPAKRIEAIEHSIMLDRGWSPWPCAAFFLDHARSIEYGANLRPRPIEIRGFEDGEMNATSKYVEIAAIFDNTGVVHGDVALVGEGVICCLRDDGVSIRGFDAGDSESPW